jgi:hypothetical protein
MIRLQVIGTAGPRSRELSAQVERVALELGVGFRLQQVEDPEVAVALGAVHTLALAVEGRVVVDGRLPHRGELERLLRRHLA